jgi:hypothetical protein
MDHDDPEASTIRLGRFVDFSPRVGELPSPPVARDFLFAFDVVIAGEW